MHLDSECPWRKRPVATLDRRCTNGILANPHEVRNPIRPGAHPQAAVNGVRLEAHVLTELGCQPPPHPAGAVAGRRSKLFMSTAWKRFEVSPDRFQAVYLYLKRQGYSAGGSPPPSPSPVSSSALSLPRPRRAGVGAGESLPMKPKRSR